MFNEEQVVSHVRRFLEENGFQDIRWVRTVQHGEDITAVSRNGEKVTIEAKGSTSSSNRSKRYGKPFNSSQLTISVSAAFYSAVARAKSGIWSGMAFPKNDAYKSRVAKIVTAQDSQDRGFLGFGRRH